MLHPLRAFRYRNFRLFFCGQSLGIIGYWVQQIAMSWLVYRLTGSAWWLGATAFAGQIAVLVLAPFGGLWADRVDRRRLLVVTQLAAGAPAFALALLAGLDVVEVWHVIVLATLLGVVIAIDAPIRQSFLPEMVPSTQDLPSAIAFNSGMYNVGRLLGPAIAGVLIIATGEAFCFLVNGVTKIIAALPFVAMVTTPRARPTAPGPIWHAFKEGVTYAWDLVPVRVLLPVVALISFMATPYQALMPIFAAEVLGGGPDMLGFLMGAAGLGGLVAIALLAARREVRGMVRWVAAACFCAGAALTVFAYSTSLALSVPMLMLAGTGIVLSVNGISTVVMTIVEERMRGRVMSFYTMAFLGMYPVGGLVAGAVASWIGAVHTLAIGGACCMLCALWLWTRLPRLREHLRPIYVKLGVVTD